MVQLQDYNEKKGKYTPQPILFQYYMKSDFSISKRLNEKNFTRQRNINLRNNGTCNSVYIRKSKGPAFDTDKFSLLRIWRIQFVLY